MAKYKKRKTAVKSAQEERREEQHPAAPEQAASARQPAAPTTPPVSPPAAPFSLGTFCRGDGLRFWILGVLLFLLIGLQGGASDKAVGVGMAVVFIACTIGPRATANLRQRLGIPTLALLAYVALNAAAGLYTRFGTFSAGEFGKIFAAFSACAIVIFRLRQERFAGFAAMFAGVSGAYALISIDASSLRVISDLFVLLMNRMGCAYKLSEMGYEAGVRVTGVFGNANILGGILALGVFLALYLVFSAKTGRGRFGGCLLLGINALGFILAFSMGAIAMFVVSALIYLLAAAKGDRLPLFLLMVETAVITVVMTFLAFPFLGGSGAAAALPVLAAPLGGVLLWLVHSFAGLRLSARLNQHKKVAGAVIAVLVVLAGAYVLLGYNLAGSYDFQAGESLRRSVYPAGGEYTLEVNTGSPGAFTVVIESQNEAETMMHTSTRLYSGPLTEAAFTVPEDSTVVYLTITAREQASLESCSLSDGTAVRLGYTLLPGFAANRIQGLWANENAIQRTVFFRDGLRIFAKSPIIGNGLGSVEGLVTSVQDFYYESRYVHNHYIQVLAEMGVVGLAVFVLLLGSCAVTLFKRRREGEADPLLPALCACLAMIALHACVEAVWSISVYQTMALLVVSGIIACCGRPIARLTGKAVGILVNVALWVFAAVFAFLLYGNIYATDRYAKIQAGLVQQTANTMTELANRDKYGWAQYKLDMAVNASDSPVEQYAQTAAEYAAQLRKLEVYSINYSLAVGHYAVLGEWEEFFAATREGIYQSASRTSSWQDLFTLYEQVFPGEENADAAWFAQQSLELYYMLQDYNDGRMEQITLTEENLAFIQRMQAIA